MKTKLLVLTLFLSMTSLYAQKLYVPGAIVKGKNATYYCTADNVFVVKVRNAKNVDTTSTMYYSDGKVVPEYDNSGGKFTFKNDDLLRVLQEVLTPEEWNSIKGKGGYSIMMNVTSDIKGNTVEIEFSFRNTDPVMTKLDPDRFYLLEQKLKKVIKLNPSFSSHPIRNMKYIQVISYRDIK